MSKGLIQSLLLCSIIIVISLFTLYPSFKLALFGDDWQQIFHYFLYLGPKSSVFDHLTYFVGGYGAFGVITGISYLAFGHDYKMYYIFSYIYKLLSAFAIFPLAFYLTRSKLAAFYASLFLSVTIIGLESTNWVVNSPAYLAVANLSLFLYFFLKSRENLKPLYFIGAAIFFYLAHIFAPVRMTGLLPFTIILEIFLYIKSPNIKLSSIRLVILFVVFAIITVTGASAGRTDTLAGQASKTLFSGFSQIAAALDKGRTDFLFYPVMTVGRIVVPDTTAIKIFPMLIYLIVFMAVFYANANKSKKVIAGIAVGIAVWSLISMLIYESNKLTLSARDALSLAIGGYFLTTAIILLFFLKKHLLFYSVFIASFWSVFSFIFPWIRAPETLNPTEHRYLVASSVGVAIFFASIIGLGKQLKNRVYLFLVVIPFLLINILATRSFLTDAVQNSHGSEAINKIWPQFPRIAEIGKTEKPLMFFFTSSPEKEKLKHHSLTFGFPFRMAFIYNIDNYWKMPIATNSWEDIVSAVSDGQSLFMNNFPKDPIPVENIYAFYLTSDNNLLNITEATREKLKDFLKQNPESNNQTGN